MLHRTAIPLRSIAAGELVRWMDKENGMGGKSRAFGFIVRVALLAGTYQTATIGGASGKKLAPQHQ